MTVRLRPHHLLCMLTFVGRGYTPEFVAHFESVVERLLAGREAIEIVSGPDEICSAMDGCEERHCTNESVAVRDQQAAEAIAALLQRPMAPGTLLELDEALLQKLQAAFSAGAIRSGCTGCQWKPLCDGIGESGFGASRLSFSRIKAADAGVGGSGHSITG